MRRLIAEPERILGSPIRNLTVVLAFCASVAVVATLAYMAAGWSFIDASYMVLLTIYTVGYGEVRPIDTPYLHTVTITTMVLGCTGMILLTSTLVQFFTIVQLREILGANRMKNRIEQLKDHVIVCGYGRIGLMLAHELAQSGAPLVIIDRDAERLAEAEALGFLVLVGDATDEDTLTQAGIDRARVLATVLPDDAANVFITLSARNLNAGLEIIARGEAPSTERKLLRAGADHVVLPTHIGAERIARMILYPRRAEGPDAAQLEQGRRALDSLGLDIERVGITRMSPIAGLSVAEAERQSAGTFMIVQINRGADHTFVRPTPNERVEPGDQLLVVLRDPSAAARTLLSQAAVG